MSRFMLAYGLLTWLWVILFLAGVEGVSVIFYVSVALIPVHLIVRFVEHGTGRPFVRRRAFAAAWWSIPAVFVIGVLATFGTNGDPLISGIFASLAVASVCGIPILGVLHLSAVRADKAADSALHQ